MNEQYKTIQSDWLQSDRAYREKREMDYILWEVTHKCNLQCIHCRAAASPITNKQNIIMGEEAIGLLEQIKKLGRPTLVFTGGEPLIRGDFIQLAEAASEYEIPFRVQSNGLLLTENIAKKLHDLGILNFGIGIDGPEKIHDTIRNKKGAFKKALKAIKILNRYDIPVHIEFTIMRLNMDYLSQTLDLLEKEVNISTFLARSVIFSGRANPKNTQMLLTPLEYREILRKIYYESKRRPFAVQSQDSLYFKVNPELLKLYKKYGDITSGNIISGCSIGLNMLDIRPNGDVGVCTFIPQVIGNVKSESLIEIWKNRTKHDFVKKIVNRELNGKCSKCPFRYVCGGCRARALSITNDLFGEDPYCW